MQAENTLQRIFSSKVVSLMKKRRVKQNDLAIQTGVTQASVSRWVKGSIPGGAELYRLARFFELPMEAFFVEGDDLTSDKIPKPLTPQQVSKIRTAIDEAVIKALSEVNF